jgi:hypothetical protein
LEVYSDQSQLRPLLEAFGEVDYSQISNATETMPDVTRLEIRSIDQSSVDSLVDRLRQHRISILRMERARPSLEQVFMNVVSSAAQGNPS